MIMSQKQKGFNFKRESNLTCNIYLTWELSHEAWLLSILSYAEFLSLARGQSYTKRKVRRFEIRLWVKVTRFEGEMTLKG